MRYRFKSSFVSFIRLSHHPLIFIIPKLFLYTFPTKTAP